MTSTYSDIFYYELGITSTYTCSTYTYCTVVCFVYIIQIVNSSTAELYIENVTFVPGRYFVYCHVWFKKELIKRKELTHQIMYVGRK